MKTFNFIVICLTVSLIVLSCSNEGKVDSQSDEPITIQVEGAKFDIIESEKLLEYSEFVFLESKVESHFGDMSYFLSNIKEFYVLDPHTKSMVFRFSNEGEFLNTIGTKGGGPGEYNNVIDALVDGDKVEILSNNVSSDVYRYSKEGNFIEKKSYEPKYPASFIKFPETGDYLFYCTSGDYKVLKTDLSGIISDSILYQKREDRIPLSIDALTPTYGGSILLNEALYNIIWKWNGSDFIEKYVLDFGDYTFYQGEKDSERYFDQEQSNGRWSIRWYQENSDYLYVVGFFLPPDVQNVADITIKHLLYSKKKARCFQLGTGDINMSLQWPFSITNENKLYLSGSPIEMADWNPWLKTVEDRNLPFDIEGNPIVIIVDLDELI